MPCIRYRPLWLLATSFYDTTQHNTNITPPTAQQTRSADTNITNFVIIAHLTVLQIACNRDTTSSNLIYLGCLQARRLLLNKHTESRACSCLHLPIILLYTKASFPRNSPSSKIPRLSFECNRTNFSLSSQRITFRFPIARGYLRAATHSTLSPRTSLHSLRGLVRVAQ
jgi:hypothetical protein